MKEEGAGNLTSTKKREWEEGKRGGQEGGAGEDESVQVHWEIGKKKEKKWRGGGS